MKLEHLEPCRGQYIMLLSLSGIAGGFRPVEIWTIFYAFPTTHDARCHNVGIPKENVESKIEGLQQIQLIPLMLKTQDRYWLDGCHPYSKAEIYHIARKEYEEMKEVTHVNFQQG